MTCGLIKRFAIAVLFLGSCTAAAAHQADTLSAKVYFHRAMYNIDMSYEHNGTTLWNFEQEFHKQYGDDPSSFDYILIRTGCSPEGGIEYNRELAFNRARSIRDYLMAHLGLSASQVRIDPVGIDWSGLRREMAKQYFPGRWDMFALMDRYGVVSNTQRGNEAACQIEMIRDRGGEPWRWMLQNIFPRLRSGEGQISIVARKPECKQECHTKRDTVVIIHRDTIYYIPKTFNVEQPVAAPVVIPQSYRAMKREQRDSLLRIPFMAFRSNLLLPAMNIGVEVPVGNRLSVAADWYYPWAWRPWMNSVYPSQKNCAQLLGGYVEARYWFGDRHAPGLSKAKFRLSGHSLAITGAGGYYDYGQNWKGKQGEFYAIGLDYMYSAILGKGGAHMDFDLGIGFFQMQSRNYEVYETGGKLYGDLERFHFGSLIPIKAGVSIVLPVFKKVDVVPNEDE